MLLKMRYVVSFCLMSFMLTILGRATESLNFTISTEDQERYQRFCDYKEQRKQDFGLVYFPLEEEKIVRFLCLETRDTITKKIPFSLEEIQRKIDKKGYYLIKKQFNGTNGTVINSNLYYIILPEETETQPRIPSDFFAKLRLKLPIGTYWVEENAWSLSTEDYLAWSLAGYDYCFSKSAWTTIKKLPSLVLREEERKTEIELLADVTTFFRDSIRMRANQFTPSVGAASMIDLARKYGATLDIISGNRLEKEFQAVYEVGKGSKDRPNVTILRWSHVNPVLTVDLVGKGVCFDTGGNNIKKDPSFMYADKGGALAQLALAELIMGMGLPIELRVGIAWVINSPGGEATNTHDIYRIGKYTVENLNTDAEGRLIMASILAHFAENNPAEFTQTQATLTGAARIGYGSTAVLYCPNRVADIMISMDKVADPVWRGPRDTRHLEGLKNSVADLGTKVGTEGGSSVADQFLCQFAAPSTTFVHVDSAAAIRSGTGITPSVTNGDMFGVRGTYEYLKSRVFSS